MPDLQAIVFDIDGTILDTREFIFGSYETTLKKFNLSVKSRQEIAAQVGHTLEVCYQNLAPGAEIAPLIKEHRKFQRENYDLISAYPGAIQLLKQVKLKGIKVGLWTGRGETVIGSLVSSGISPDLYDCVVEAGMYEKSKPDPEGFLITIEKLGAVPEKSVLVGDSVMDIQAGKRGSAAATVAVTHGFGMATALKQSNPDYIIDSLTDFSEVLETIEQNNG